MQFIVFKLQFMLGPTPELQLITTELQLIKAELQFIAIYCNLLQIIVFKLQFMLYLNCN